MLMYVVNLFATLRMYLTLIDGMDMKMDMKRRVLITTFRGQAEPFVYGITENVLQNYA